jgi:hypothetical protein
MNSLLESFGKPDHDRWMGAALAEAEVAAEKDEVPIGCVIVHNGLVIGRGHNLTESLQDPTAHAEMIAITAAAEALGSRRLLDCTLYVTLGTVRDVRRSDCARAHTVYRVTERWIPKPELVTVSIPCWRIHDSITAHISCARCVNRNAPIFSPDFLPRNATKKNLASLTPNST